MPGWTSSAKARRRAGKIAAVDYDIYAAGEAALGWMNASASLRARGDIDWSAYAGRLLEAIRGELRAVGPDRPSQVVSHGRRRPHRGQPDQQRRPAVAARRDRRPAAGSRAADQRPRARPTGGVARRCRKGVAGGGRRATGDDDHEPCGVSSRAGRSRRTVTRRWCETDFPPPAGLMLGQASGRRSGAARVPTP